MHRTTQIILFWVPRILCIMYALFISLFALDVWGEGVGFWKAIVGFVIHLIPVYILLITLYVAWRWPVWGALMFVGFALFYCIQTWNSQNVIAMLVISGPLLVIGILFFINWKYHIQKPS